MSEHANEKASGITEAEATAVVQAAVKAVEPEPSLEDSVHTLLVLIKAHRTIGDSDVDAAVAGVESALASWGT